MSNEIMSIAERIEYLSRRTHAPTTFVRQVRSLFSSKGISLEDDATPYLTALEQAFQREESIRRSTLSARRNLNQIQKQFSSISDHYKKQISRLERIKHTLDAHSRRMKDTRGTPRKKPAVVLYSSNPRSLITRQETEEMPMVPGPEDPQ